MKDKKFYLAAVFHFEYEDILFKVKAEDIQKHQFDYCCLMEKDNDRFIFIKCVQVEIAEVDKFILHIGHTFHGEEHIFDEFDEMIDKIKELNNKIN